jgi:hypothetical protein
VPDSLFDLAAAHFALDTDGASSALFDGLPGQWIADGACVRLLARLAGGAPDTWPATLSRHALRRLRSVVPAVADTGHPWLVRQLLSSLALVLDPATAAAFDPIRLPDAQWQSAIDEFLDLARLRHEMTLSFQEPA